MELIKAPPKALSMTQPWARLILTLSKRIETRSWGTGHRGRLFIHAAKNFPEWAKRECLHEPFRSALLRTGLPAYGPRLQGEPVPDVDQLPVQAIVGCVELVACHRIDGGYATPAEPELSFGNYEKGRWAWHTANPVMFNVPIPCSGALNLWDCYLPLRRWLDTVDDGRAVAEATGGNALLVWTAAYRADRDIIAEAVQAATEGKRIGSRG